MKFRAAIFDIDGTLLDSVDLHAEAWRQVFLLHGQDIAFERIRSQIGKGGDQLLPMFFSKEELDRYGKEMEVERGKLFKNEFLPKVKPFPGVRALFERVKENGLKIALASSSKKDELEHYAEMLDITDLIEAGTSSDDAAKSKPHPDIFQAAVDKLSGVPTGTCVAIGDTPYDAEAAGKIGIETIGMLCGGFLERDLRGAGARTIYRDPEDLLSQFAASPLGRG